MDIALPEAVLPDVAPLPLPLAQHLYQYWVSHNEQGTLYHFLTAIKEKRESVYIGMDSFVRNRDRDLSPHRLCYSNQWLRETLGEYTPNKQPISPKTFNHWVRAGFIRNSKKGQPTPDSGAALCLMRMMIEGTRLLPHCMSADEPAWWCYAQDGPTDARRCVPIGQIEQLPARTLLWTPWPGAAWDTRWMLLSDKNGGDYFGAIRFAGAEAIHSQIYYNVSKEDILYWMPGFAQHFTARLFQEDELQANARAVLIQLAEDRVTAY